MKLPKSLVIGDSIWKIERKRLRESHYGKEVIGLCDPMTQTIIIKTGLKPREALDTLVHECLHAIEDEYDLKIDHALIHSLESKISQLLIDNFIGEI